MNETNTLMQQRMDSIVKEPRSHIHLDSQDRFDAISKNGLSDPKERTERFCGGTREVQKNSMDTEEKDEVQSQRKNHILFTEQRWQISKCILIEIEIILNQQSLAVTERAVNMEIGSSAVGNGHGGMQCQGTASCLLPQHMQESKGLLQFLLVEECLPRKGKCQWSYKEQVPSAWPSVF